MHVAKARPADTGETDEVDSYGRPSNLQDLPVPAILALAAATGVGDALGLLARGSENALLEAGFIDERGRLTRRGARSAEDARRWSESGPAAEHIKAADAAVDRFLTRVADGQVKLT